MWPTDDQWVWVLVERRGTRENVVGRRTVQDDLAYIPFFADKADAEACLGPLAGPGDTAIEVQAMVYEDLAAVARDQKVVLFLVDGRGKVLERRAP